MFCYKGSHKKKTAFLRSAPLALNIGKCENVDPFLSLKFYFFEANNMWISLHTECPRKGYYPNFEGNVGRLDFWTLWFILVIPDLGQYGPFLAIFGHIGQFCANWTKILIPQQSSKTLQVAVLGYNVYKFHIIVSKGWGK